MKQIIAKKHVSIELGWLIVGLLIAGGGVSNFFMQTTSQIVTVTMDILGVTAMAVGALCVAFGIVLLCAPSVCVYRIDDNITYHTGAKKYTVKASDIVDVELLSPRDRKKQHGLLVLTVKTADGNKRALLNVKNKTEVLKKIKSIAIEGAN